MSTYVSIVNRLSQYDRQPRGTDPILPAVLEFLEETEETFLHAVITDVEPSAPQFKLAPTYTLYLSARYRASTHYRPELQPTERAHRLTVMLANVATMIQRVIQVYLNTNNFLPQFNKLQKDNLFRNILSRYVIYINNRVFKEGCIFSGTLHGRLVLGLLAGKRLRATTHAEERPARGCIFHAGAGHPGGRGAHGFRLAGTLRHAGTNAGDDAVHGGRGRAGERGRGAADLLEHYGAAATMPGERRVDDTIVQPSVSRDQRYSI